MSNIDWIRYSEKKPEVSGVYLVAIVPMFSEPEDPPPPGIYNVVSIDYFVSDESPWMLSEGMKTGFYEYVDDYEGGHFNRWDDDLIVYWAKYPEPPKD